MGLNVLSFDVSKVTDFIEQREEIEAMMDGLPGAGAQAVICDALAIAPATSIGRDRHTVV